MYKIIALLQEELEDMNELIDGELWENLRNEKTQRDLTQKEIEKLNKYRKKVFYIYKAIEILNKIEE